VNHSQLLEISKLNPLPKPGKHDNSAATQLSSAGIRYSPTP
jgi:hypothetical protein